MVVSHRWLSLLLGVVLLVEVVSGVVLLYQSEIHRSLNASAFRHADGPTRSSMGEAAEAVAQAHPSYAATAVVEAHGVYSVTDYETAWNVDPSTGEVLGHVAALPGWLGFLANLHECGLTCEGTPGYWSAADHPVPGTAWLSPADPAEDLSIGDLALGVVGLLLLFLCLSGLWLWFPRPGRWRPSMTVRRGRGRFARDTDLHRVIGMASLIPLLVFAVTGAGFEIKQLGDAWYAVLPGAEQPIAEAPAHNEDVAAALLDPDQAAARAEAAVPGARAVTVSLLAAGDRATPYDVWLSTAHDPYGPTDYPGDVEVAVDARTGATTVQFGDPSQSGAQHIWEAWSYPVHSGFVVNGWWRVAWLVLGATPVALAVTGVSTWLVRRRTARRRRRARRQRQAAGAA